MNFAKVIDSCIYNNGKIRSTLMNEGRDLLTNSERNKKCRQTPLDHLFFASILEIDFCCSRVGKREIADLSDKSEPIVSTKSLMVVWSYSGSLSDPKHRKFYSFSCNHCYCACNFTITTNLIGKTSLPYPEAREKAETSHQGDVLRFPHPHLDLNLY